MHCAVSSLHCIFYCRALHAIPLNSPRFWQKVAESVETRTAQECQSKYEGQLLEGKPKREIKTKQAKPTQKGKTDNLYRGGAVCVSL